VELVYSSKADVEDLGMSLREVIDALDLGFAAEGRGETRCRPGPASTRTPTASSMIPAHVDETPMTNEVQS
jgi:hypothetical protein